jgi:signal transduction histidine kinase/CheY-like chemotaxis protein
MSHNGTRSMASSALRRFGLIGSLLLALSLPLFWLAWDAEITRDQAAMTVQSAADQIQAGIREQLGRFERATAGLRAQDVQGDTTLLTARLLRMEPIVAPASGLSVVSVRGVQIASTLPSSSNAAAPAWLARALAVPRTREPLIISPDPTSDRQSWVLVRRIEDGQGATLAVAAASLPTQVLRAVTMPTVGRASFLAYTISDGTGVDLVRIPPEQLDELEPLRAFKSWIRATWLSPQTASFTLNNLHWTVTADPAALLGMRADQITHHGQIAIGLAIALGVLGTLLTFFARRGTVPPYASEMGAEPSVPASSVEIEADGLRRKLGDLAQERDRVLAAIGHDVRTPINSILGICALLSDGDLDDGQRKWLQRIRASCEALLAMLNGMLEIAAARVDGAELHKEAVDLASLVEEVGEVLRPQAHDKGLELRVAIEASVLGAWNTDPTRLRQVLFNLAGNAVKYTMQGSIEIHARASVDEAGQGMLELRVSDTGPGIAENEQELIFEQFRRGRDEVSRGQEGLGLGLALCREIAALLDGSLAVESTLSVGSVFTFKMPIEQIQLSRPRGAPLAGRTALVVGLSEGLRRRVAAHLESIGFDVETTGDGFMALGAAERVAYQHGNLDLIVLDATLVGLPADVLLVRLQANRAFERLRTVLVCNGPVVGSIEGRADLVVSHPVEASDLDRAVGSLFETSSPLHDVCPRAPASPKKRVLVVEDNRINQALFLDVLNRSNFSAFAASSGEEAVLAAERGGFDVILMDVQMPGIDGAEATRRIRAMHAEGRIPIVGLTAHSGTLMRKRCIDAGMDLVLHKPVDLSRLPLRIREVIDAASSASSDPVEDALDHDYTLDIADEYVEVLIAEIGIERGRTCITAFLADTAIHIPSLIQQAETEDWQAMANLSHNLAGAAGTLGATALTDALLMLEDCARLKDKTGLHSALKEVEAVWNRTRIGLRQRFDVLSDKRGGTLKKVA